MNDLPIAISQEHIIAEGNTIPITLTAKDVDLDLLTYSLVELPRNGTIEGTPPYISYTPKETFWGIEQFTFIANDGLNDSAPAIIRLNVGIPDVPVITAEDHPVSIKPHLSMISSADDFILTTPPEKVNLAETAPNLVYIPNANVHGYDSFTLSVKDTTESITLQIYMGAF